MLSPPSLLSIGIIMTWLCSVFVFVLLFFCSHPLTFSFCLSLSSSSSSSFVSFPFCLSFFSPLILHLFTDGKKKIYEGRDKKIMCINVLLPTANFRCVCYQDNKNRESNNDPSPPPHSLTMPEFFFFFPDESNLKMNSVDHVPQTLASHIRLPEVSPPQGLEGGGSMQHGADMLKPDPRDTFYSSKSASHHFQAVPLFLSSSLLSCYHFPSTDWLTVWLRLSL